MAKGLTSAYVPLGRKVVSKIGRLDVVRVAVVDGAPDGARLVPVATSGASLLSSTVSADGLLLVPPASEGYDVGDVVEFFAFDGPTP